MAVLLVTISNIVITVELLRVLFEGCSGTGGKHKVWCEQGLAMLCAMMIQHCKTVYNACQVRATTAKCLAATASHMTAEQWQLYSTKQLLVAAGKLVSDNTPEARGAAKGLISTMKGAYTESAKSSIHEVCGCTLL